MKPLRKPFDGDPRFPFALVHRAERSPQNELPDHLHDRYELVYVHSGHGTLFIDHRFYEQRPGDLFAIPGNTIHRAFPDAEAGIVSSAIFFAPAFAEAGALDDAYSPLGLFEAARKRQSYKLSLPDELRRTVESALERIGEELSRQEVGHREAVRLSLCGLLLQLNRHAASSSAPEAVAVRVGPPWFETALRSIDARPEQAHSLSALAGSANVSAPHFSRVFKQLTGLNVTDYIHAKRIVLAKRLLAETDDKVETVAVRCGFDSLPHFHRVFKRIAGTTPNAHRRQHGTQRPAQ